MTADEPSPDGPWSPFPVQDWSTMPPASAPAPDPASSAVDPRWAPPGRRLPRWLPSLVVALAVALSGTGLWAVAHVSRGIEGPSSVFLPPDGASWYGDLDRGGAVAESETFNESSRLGALEATQSLSFDYGAQLLGSLGQTEQDELGAARAWRVTSVELGAGTSAEQRVRTYRTDDGIELMADSGPDGAQVYTPAMRELPADPKPGQRWQSEGRTLNGGSYLTDFTASDAGLTSPADRGCLDVRGSIAYGPAAGGTSGTSREISVERTWCPGRGLVRSSERAGSAAVTEVIVAPSPPAPGAADVDLEPVAVTWSSPSAWTARGTDVRSPDPDSGDSALAARPTAVPPVALTGGLLVRAVTQGSDLVVMSGPTSGRTSWQVVRRLHPGGAVIMLASYGDLLVVATTERALIAYRPDGRRAWQTRLDDVVTTVPARSGDAIAAISASGDLRMIDLRSGAVRWRDDLRADVSAAPTADDTLVVVADRSGQLTAYRADDGVVRWRTDTADPVAAVIINDRALQLAQGSDFDTRDLTDGTLLSRQAVPGTFRALRPVGGLAVLASTAVTQAVDPDGRRVWTGAGYDDLTTDGQTLIGWRADRGDVVSAAGAVLGSLRLGPVRASETRQYLRYGPGILVCSTVFTDIGVWS